jgi:hypothetical protein
MDNSGSDVRVMGSWRMHSQQIVRNSGRRSLARIVRAKGQKDEGLQPALARANRPAYLAGPPRLPGSEVTPSRPANQQDPVRTRSILLVVKIHLSLTRFGHQGAQ